MAPDGQTGAKAAIAATGSTAATGRITPKVSVRLRDATASADIYARCAVGGDMPDPLVALALGTLLVGTEAFFTVLSVLNLRHETAAVEREADWIREELAIDDPERIVDYHRAKTGVSLLKQWTILALVLLVLFSGLFADAVAGVQSLGLSTLLEGGVFVAGTLLVVRLTGIPFDLVDTFVVEEVFDFNERSLRLWTRDFLLGTAVLLVLAVPLAVAIFWIVETVPYWPVAAWALVMTFQVAMLVLKPRVIDPLFYDFERVETGELRAAVEDVFDRAGFACEQIYEMDYSSRSSHSNAYFVGFGRTKRVVLFDTLVEDMSVPEVQSVLAHELAHWKRGHIWKFVALSAVQLGVLFAIAGSLVGAAWLYAPFAVPETAYVGILLALLWLLPLTRLLSPLENHFSLRFEREADTFAAETVGGETMAGALATLAAENLATLFPHDLYETFHYSHPPIPERMRNVREIGGGGKDSPDAAGSETTGPGGTDGTGAGG
jgi:STE24 endopeptidase